MTVITQWGMLLHYSCCIWHWRISHKWTAHILPYFMQSDAHAKVIKTEKMEEVIKLIWAVFFIHIIGKEFVGNLGEIHNNLLVLSMYMCAFCFYMLHYRWRHEWLLWTERLALVVASEQPFMKKTISVLNKQFT